MMRHCFWWVGMHRDVHQHVNSCKLHVQFLPNRMYIQPMHLEIPEVPFAGCAMDCIGPLPATSKGNRHALNFYLFINFIPNYSTPEVKTADEVPVAYIKEILPKT